MKNPKPEVTNVLGAVLPKIDNGTLSWNNDARYCVTPGVLWGEARSVRSVFEALQAVAAWCLRSYVLNTCSESCGAA